jgi:hypothetical protein
MNFVLIISGCSVATQANCPNFLPNSYCNLGTLLCECPAGYTTAANTVECEYSKFVLFLDE